MAQSFSSPILSIVSPLSEGANRTGLGWLNLFSFFQAKSLLLQENKKLLQENLDLKLSLAIRRDLEKENQELKKLIRLTDDENKKPIIAKVLLTPNIISSGIIILEVGQKNIKTNFKPGDLVVYNDKVLLGRVLEVGDYQTKVELISATKSVSVLVGSKSILAEAVGLGSGNFSITLPKGAEVFEGDVVLAPEYGGYLLGLVDIIKKTNADPFQTILFNSPINIFQVKWVEIYAA
ncbi:MAG: rod shape-determining protein MreC [Candidatus Paceibacterota bacterium]